MGYNEYFEDTFFKSIKNLDKPLKELIMKNYTKKILISPLTEGKRLDHDLKGIMVYKFSYAKTEYRIGYYIQDSIIIFIYIGHRSIFYDKIKKLN